MSASVTVPLGRTDTFYKGHGYRKSASGLIVPEPLSRTRRVIPRADWRAFEKALDVLKRLDVTLQLRCDAPDCDDRTLVRSGTDDGGIALTCGCSTRVFTKAF